MNELKGKRENLLRKHNRTKDPDKKKNIFSEIQLLAPKIEHLNSITKMCKDIAKRSLEVNKDIVKIRTPKEKEKVKNKKKNRDAR